MQIPHNSASIQLCLIEIAAAGAKPLQADTVERLLPASFAMRPFFHAGQAFQQGWQGFSRNAAVLVGFSVIGFVVLALLQLSQASVLEAASISDTPIAWIVLQLGVLALQAVVSLVISMALLHGSLAAVRGDKLTPAGLFARMIAVPDLLGLQLFAGLACGIGMLIFLLPGVYLAVAYGLAGYALVDGRGSFVDALNLSRRLVSPHWFDLALYYLVVAAIIALGLLACLVGGFVSVPVGFCMLAAAYQQLLQQS